jgi:hypothetical protein
MDLVFNSKDYNDLINRLIFRTTEELAKKCSCDDKASYLCTETYDIKIYEIPNEFNPFDEYIKIEEKRKSHPFKHLMDDDLSALSIKIAYDILMKIIYIESRNCCVNQFELNIFLIHLFKRKLFQNTKFFKYMPFDYIIETPCVLDALFSNFDEIHKFNTFYLKQDYIRKISEFLRRTQQNYLDKSSSFFNFMNRFLIKFDVHNIIIECLAMKEEPNVCYLMRYIYENYNFDINHFLFSVFTERIQASDQIFQYLIK